MLFDQVASLIEQNPEFDKLTRLGAARRGLKFSPRKIVETAKIFDLRGTIAHELFNEDGIFSDKRIAFMEENFMMPFPSVCIEDGASCLFLADIPEEDMSQEFIDAMNRDASDGVMGTTAGVMGRIKDDPFTDDPPTMERGAGERGIPCVRLFIEWMPPQGDPAAFDSKFGTPDNTFLEFRGMLSAGVIFFTMKASDNPKKTPMAVGGQVFAGIDLDGGTATCFSGRGLPPQVHASAMNNPAVAIKQAIVLQSPGRFIIEETGANTAKVEKAKKRAKRSRRILRSDARPRHIVLKPKEIRERIGLMAKGSGKKAEHPRRAHPRTLVAERWANLRGQTIMVKSSWVGASETVLKGRRYRVLLDS